MALLRFRFPSIVSEGTKIIGFGLLIEWVVIFKIFESLLLIEPKITFELSSFYFIWPGYPSNISIQNSKDLGLNISC